MKRHFLLTCYITLMLIFATKQGFAQQFMDDMLQLPTGEMFLAPPEDYEGTKKPVQFSHSVHFKFACKSCHHNWDTVSEIKSCSAAECHDNFWPVMSKNQTAEKSKNISLTAACHRACRSCHRVEAERIEKIKAKDLNSGPVACDACHAADVAEANNRLDIMSVPRGIITLKAPEGTEAKRSPVEFPHSNHFIYACNDCHHTWNGESPVQNCTTSGCHDKTSPVASSGDINKPENIPYYLAAYHKACLYCHRNLKEQSLEMNKNEITDQKQIPKYGPVACSGCHQ